MGVDFFIPFLPSHSLICHFTDGNQSGNWSTVRETRLPRFSAASLSFFTTSYIKEVKWAREYHNKWLKRQDILLSSVTKKLCCKGVSNSKFIHCYWHCWIKNYDKPLIHFGTNFLKDSVGNCPEKFSHWKFSGTEQFTKMFRFHWFLCLPEKSIGLVYPQFWCHRPSQ